MANQTTKIQDLINPEVMGDMISAKIPQKIVVTPFAKIDTTLQGVPGDTITVPKYDYIGDAVDVAEGVSAETCKLTTTTTQTKIKKAMKAVEVTDEAVLSGYGNPMGEANAQLAKAIASKMDNDAMDALLGAKLVRDTGAKISYNGVVDVIDVFNEEVNTEKVMFVNPKQVTSLRKDANFISADKYTGRVIMTGEIGMIANARIVPSKKVKLNEADMYFLTIAEPEDWATKYTSYYTKSGSSYTAVTGNSAPAWEESKYYSKLAAGKGYVCPVVKLTGETETEDAVPAITIYMKRGVNVETERHTLARKTDVSVDEFYAVALTNAERVVLGVFGK